MPDLSRTSARRSAPTHSADRRRSAPGTLDEEHVDELLAGLPANADFETIGDTLATADLGLRVDLMSRVQGLASNAGASALVSSSSGHQSMSVQRDADGDGGDLSSGNVQGQDQLGGQGGDDASMLAWLPSTVYPIAAVFSKVVSSNIAAASAITVPARYVTLLNAYAAFNTADGAILTAGNGRSPSFYSGGWILDIQTAAKAMTLDTSVFVRGELDLATYIHEMVHVKQYGDLGPTNFLVSYFGLSALEIAKRLLMHLPISAMTASPMESQAYALEGRFMDWWRAHPEADPATPPSGGSSSP